MPFTFADLCRRSDEDYSLLRRRTDACAQLGRSYELRCILPESCTPGEAMLGFFRIGGRYQLYTRPQVCYRGRCSALAELFSPGMHSFPDFSALRDQLRRLGQALQGQTGAETPPLCRVLRSALAQQVMGQEEAVEAAAFRLYTHLCKPQPQRPLSLIFFGPTGTGKSELGKAIHPILQQIFPERQWRFVWTELNTFTEPHSVYRLTGAPPGYVGYQDRPVFECVRENPSTIFMFDELDKAHPEVLKVFMSILDEGRCAARQEDKSGQRELKFHRCIFLFTTNLDLSGSKNFRPGFAEATKDPAETVQPDRQQDIIRRLLAQDERARRAMVRSGVLREIAGRFTGLIGFHPLDEASRRAITAKQIAGLGREFGLHIASIAPEIVAGLTPKDVFSVRSTAAVLEGALTPLFADCADLAGRPLCLVGTPEHMKLTPAKECHQRCY